MKELSIEEKAKRYDEALEAIKSLQEVNPSDEGIQNWVNENFPELKESEDEKIRKRIISALVEWEDKCSFPCDSDDMIAWLEKQGEQKPQGKTALEAIKEEKVDNANKVEQKSAWNEEDKAMLNSFLHKLEVCDLLSNKEGIWIKNKLKALKDRVQPQNTWKPSEKQMKALNSINVIGSLSYPGQGQELINLYQDLKKLKG